jgi:hypothetical protein
MVTSGSALEDDASEGDAEDAVAVAAEVEADEDEDEEEVSEAVAAASTPDEADFLAGTSASLLTYWPTTWPLYSGLGAAESALLDEDDAALRLFPTAATKHNEHFRSKTVTC